MDIKAEQARREYNRRYREKNREKINARRREWNKQNRDRIAEYQSKYYQNLAQKYEKESTVTDAGMEFDAH